MDGGLVPEWVTRGMVSFGWGRSPPVPAHMHPHGKGWVADTAEVHPSAYVGPNAMVWGTATVEAEAVVRDHARVMGRVDEGAVVRDNAFIGPDAHVCWQAEVCGSVSLSGDVTVHPGAVVSGVVRIEQKCVIPRGSYLLTHPVVVSLPDGEIATMSWDKNGNPLVYMPGASGPLDVVLGRCKTRKPTPFREARLLALNYLKSMHETKAKIAAHRRQLVSASRQRRRQKKKEAA